MYIKEYLDYIENEKRVSKNTLDAYKKDIFDFYKFITLKGEKNIGELTKADMRLYMEELKSKNRSSATINRKIASVKSFFDYSIRKGYININPAEGLRKPKIERKNLDYLSIEEIDKILSMPDDSIKGKRDSAILELLYATGIRVSEIVDILVSDVNIRMGFISCCTPHSKPRVIPLGRPARAALEEYIYDVRPKINTKGENVLFLNYRGERLTRQGLWKMIKKYAEAAEIEATITPQIFRNSFAAHMIQNGADIKSLQELLGHEDVSTTQIYLSLTKNRIKEVYDNAHPRA